MNPLHEGFTDAGVLPVWGTRRLPGLDALAADGMTTLCGILLRGGFRWQSARRPRARRGASRNI